jgi:replicative DNA helicase
MNGQMSIAIDAGLTSSSFSDKTLVDIFIAMRKAFDSGDDIDLANVAMKLDNPSLVQSLVDICEKSPTSQNVLSFIEEMRKSAWVKSTYLKIANIAKGLMGWKEFQPIEAI